MEGSPTQTDGNNGGQEGGKRQSQAFKKSAVRKGASGQSQAFIKSAVRKGASGQSQIETNKP